jgi:hypothetical protein
MTNHNTAISQWHSTKRQLPGSLHTKLAPVININKDKRQKPVFNSTSKPKNIEIRIKHGHRYSSLSKNNWNWQPIKISYLNFCRDRRVCWNAIVKVL